MKNIIRAFVFTLTLTGAAAFTSISNTIPQVVKPRPTSMPIPLCPPGDPHGCGLGR